MLSIMLALLQFKFACTLEAHNLYNIFVLFHYKKEKYDNAIRLWFGRHEDVKLIYIFYYKEKFQEREVFIFSKNVGFFFS